MSAVLGAVFDEWLRMIVDSNQTINIVDSRFNALRTAFLIRYLHFF